MLLLDSIALFPLSILGFVAFSKFWLLFLVGFLVMKFSRSGGGGCCGRSELKGGSPPSGKEHPYDEDDIVPDKL